MNNGGSSSSSSTSTTTKEQIPRLLLFWRNLYKKTHTARFDVTLTIATSLFLTLLRFLSEYIQVHFFGWPADSLATKEAAGSVVAIFHSINLVPALWLCFQTQRYSPSGALKDAPTWWQDSVTALLQFCTGYMLYDGILNIILLKWDVWQPDDTMFLLHHLATTLYMSSTRVLGAGHMSAMMCMLLGECTNPFHNGYYVAQAALKLDCCSGRLTQQLHTVIECVFCSAYCLMRAIIAPILCVHMSYDLIRNAGPNRSRIPVPIIVIWNIMIWGVILGSIPWIQECWTVLETVHLPEQLKFGQQQQTSTTEL